MTISFIGANSGTTTANAVAHVSGDLILIYSSRNGNTTAPTLGSGYTSVITGQGGSGVNAVAVTVGYKIATATNDTSSTWTNATNTASFVYRGTSGILLSGFSQALANNNTATFSVPALSGSNAMYEQSGSSWIVGFSSSNTATTIGNTPGGMTQRLTSQARIAAYDTNGGVSAWAGNTATGPAGTWVGVSVELTDKTQTHLSLDPQNLGSGLIAGMALSNNNQTATVISTTGHNAYSVDSITTVKSYLEWSGNITADGSAAMTFEYSGASGATGFAVWNTTNGAIVTDKGTSVTGFTATNGHVIGAAVDPVNGLVWFRDITAGSNWNNNSSANPSANLGGISFTPNTAPLYWAAPSSAGSTGAVITFNSGNRAFSGAVPTGFYAFGASTGSSQGSSTEAGVGSSQASSPGSSIGSRENLCVISQSYFVFWTYVGTPTVTDNTVTAPDGTTTASTWTRTVAADQFGFFSVTKPAVVQNYTFSLYVKSNTAQYATIRLQGNYPAFADAILNFATGTVSYPGFGTLTELSVVATPLNNGWYRLSLSTQSDTATTISAYFSFNDNGVGIDGTDSSSTSSGYVWGAQIEQGVVASSYIPTSNSPTFPPIFGSAGDAQAFGSSQASATGSASGSASVSGVGQSQANSAGSASGSSTDTAVGSSQANSAGSSSGSSTESATGQSKASSSGSSSGSASVSGVVEGQASSTGSASVSGSGQSQASAAGSSSGSSTEVASGASQTSVTGSSSGSSTEASTGQSQVSAAGSSSGSASATGASGVTNAGSSSGSAAVSAVGQSNAVAAGSSSGSTSVLAQEEGAGASQGSASTSGVGQSQALATGSSVGSSTESTTGSGSTDSVGSSSGSSTESTTGSSHSSASGSSSGSSTEAAVGSSLTSTTGSSVGSSTDSAVGGSNSSGSGSSVGTSSESAAGSGYTDSSGSSSGSSVGGAVGTGGHTALGTSFGSSASSGAGSSLVVAGGSVVGSCSVTAVGVGVWIVIGSSAGAAAAAAMGSTQQKAVRGSTVEVSANAPSRIPVVFQKSSSVSVSGPSSSKLTG